MGEKENWRWTDESNYNRRETEVHYEENNSATLTEITHRPTDEFYSLNATLSSTAPLQSQFSNSSFSPATSTLASHLIYFLIFIIRISWKLVQPCWRIQNIWLSHFGAWMTSLARQKTANKVGAAKSWSLNGLKSFWRLNFETRAAIVGDTRHERLENMRWALTHVYFR